MEITTTPTLLAGAATQTGPRSADQATEASTGGSQRSALSGLGGETSGATAAAPSAAADFDTFLRLLTAQLRNQDPLQPIDSTEFVAQLASFSTVEQLIGTNDRLDALIADQQAGGAADLVDWIGREVASFDGRFRATGEPRSFTVPGLPGADQVQAVVLRADGLERARIDLPVAGTGRASWDGLDAEGNAILGEDLAIELVYFSDGAEIGRQAAGVLGEVAGLRAGSFGPELLLADGTVLRPEEVSQVGGILTPDSPEA